MLGKVNPSRLVEDKFVDPQAHYSIIQYLDTVSKGFETEPVGLEIEFRVHRMHDTKAYRTSLAA